MGSDPLIDTLFRPTVLSAAAASAPPQRRTGSHVRAGNAMARSRAALLDGARRAVLDSGTRITMGQVAASAGIAKGTLYNHFRTRDAVLAALLDAEIDVLLRQLADRPLPEALAAAARAISEHPLVRVLQASEPATLAVLARVDPSRGPWRRVRDGVAEVLAEFDRRGADVVVRWLSSYLLAPGTAAGIAQDVDTLVAGLPWRLALPVG